MSHFNHLIFIFHFNNHELIQCFSINRQIAFPISRHLCPINENFPIMTQNGQPIFVNKFPGRIQIEISITSQISLSVRA